MREAARRFRVPLATVQYWVTRTHGQALDEVNWTNRPRGPRRPANRTDAATEDLVLTVRQELRQTSALGEFGAAAVRREFQARGVSTIPSARTVGRIFLRRGALDGRRRVRRLPPPRGWYLPQVAAGQAELDAFDVIEGLVIQGGLGVEVLTGLSLHGGLPAAWPEPQITAKKAVKRLIRHWREAGLPTYAQFDNDTLFQGAHQYPDTVGRISRLCLALGVVPVFTPPREMGFQGAIEGYNGRWQAKVWSRFHHRSRPDLRRRSDAYLAAARAQGAARIDAAPTRRPFPENWRLNLRAPLRGRIIYLRRTDEHGRVELLGHRFAVDPHWPHRLVRAEVDLDAGVIRFYALRRRDPTHQPLLKEVPHTLPQRPFLG
jgi:hypothetical protein